MHSLVALGMHGLGSVESAAPVALASRGGSPYRLLRHAMPSMTIESLLVLERDAAVDWKGTFRP
jgi:hypothetical protein